MTASNLEEPRPDLGSRLQDRPVPEHILEGLNPNQRAAVSATEGPVLVVAGAGSGKTQVLTRRVAGLIASGVDPRRILAITFTNKAAGEMRTRVGDLVGTGTMEEMWVCTFHSMCVRILRQSGPHRFFTILDQRDARNVLKEILDGRGIDSSGGVLRKVQTYISNAKNRLVKPAPDRRNQAAQIASEVFDEYQARLRSMKAYDFDDLLTETVRLFADHPDVRRQWQDRFDYILIDEYQDTNRAQYVIVRALAAKHRNICAVGDPDQSIYSFRAANVENILNFETDYEDCRIFTLDQNYRSTKKILRAAQAVIAENKGQRRAHLWTEGEEGEEILLYVAFDDRDEAAYVAKRIRSVGEPGDHAVLYRANFQSRVIEEALAEEGIPYMLVGGTRFYDRAEVRDALAYLRFANNPTDIVSFQRSVNSPRRGIGSSTVEAVLAWAEAVGEENLFVAAETAELPTRARNAINRWLEAIRHVRDLSERYGPGPALAGAVVGHDGDLAALRRAVAGGQDPLAALSASAGEEGLARQYLRRGDPESRDRLGNLVELVGAADRWVANQFGVNLTEGEELDWAKIDGREQTSAFLEHVALITDLEFAEETQGGAGAVRLMTIHAAKGLEFPHVTVVGLEDGILPMGGPDELAEERRLAYVAITRAEKTLALTRARRRFVFGDVRTSPPSPFLEAVEGTLSYTPGELAWQKKTGGIQPASRYEVGMWVRHDKFGRGQVFSVTGDGADAVVGVLFQDGTRRTLHTRYAKLTVDDAA